MGPTQLNLLNERHLWSCMITTQENQDVLAYFEESYTRVSWHAHRGRYCCLAGCLLAHWSWPSGLCICLHGPYSSVETSTCVHNLGMLKCCLTSCFWINTMSLHYMISNSSFKPNSVCYRVRDWHLPLGFWVSSWSTNVISRPGMCDKITPSPSFLALFDLPSLYFLSLFP